MLLNKQFTIELGYNVNKKLKKKDDILKAFTECKRVNLFNKFNKLSITIPKCSCERIPRIRGINSICFKFMQYGKRNLVIRPKRLLNKQKHIYVICFIFSRRE